MRLLSLFTITDARPVRDTPPLPDVPVVPAGLTAVAGDASMSLTWTASAGATSYNVYRDGAKVGTVAGTSFAQSGLTNGQPYAYQVSAVNAGGESARSTAVAVTPMAEEVPVEPTAAEWPMAVGAWQEEDGPNGAEYRYPTPNAPHFAMLASTNEIRLMPDGRRIWHINVSHNELWSRDKCIDPVTGNPTYYVWMRPENAIAYLQQVTADAIALWESQGITEIHFVEHDSETRWLKQKITSTHQKALVADPRWAAYMQDVYNEELRLQSGNPDAVFRWSFQGGMIGGGSVSDDDVHNAVFWAEQQRAHRMGHQEPVNAWCGRVAGHPDGRLFVGDANYENEGQPLRRDLDPPVDRRTPWNYGDDQIINRLEGVSPAPTLYCNGMVPGRALSGVGSLCNETDGGSAWLLALGMIRQLGAARLGADIDPDGHGKGMAPGGANEITVSPWLPYEGDRYNIRPTRLRSYPDTESRSLTQEPLFNPYGRARAASALMASGQYAGRITPLRVHSSRTWASNSKCKWDPAARSGQGGWKGDCVDENYPELDALWPQSNAEYNGEQRGTVGANNASDQFLNACLEEHIALVGAALPRHPVRTGEFPDWFAGANGKNACLTHVAAMGLRDATGRAHYAVSVERKNAPMIPSQTIIDTWQPVTVRALREGVEVGTFTVAAGDVLAYYSDPIVSSVDLTFEVMTHETRTNLIPEAQRDMAAWPGTKVSPTTAVDHPHAGIAGLDVETVYVSPNNGGVVYSDSPAITLTDCAPGEVVIAHLYVRHRNDDGACGLAVLDSNGAEIVTLAATARLTWESRFVRFAVPADRIVRFRAKNSKSYCTSPSIMRFCTTPAIAT